MPIYQKSTIEPSTKLQGDAGKEGDRDEENRRDETPSHGCGQVM
jgi:hypothetical protein